MKDASKIASKQDCNYAINQGNSNETSVKLTEDMLAIFCLPEADNQQYNFVLKIFRDDLYRMLAYIVSNLPLFNKKGEMVYFSAKFYQKKLHEINNFFGDDEEKDYPIVLLNNRNRSACIQGFPSELNIRDFMVEGATIVSLSKMSSDVELHITPRYRAIEKQLLSTERKPFSNKDYEAAFRKYLYSKVSIATANGYLSALRNQVVIDIVNSCAGDPNIFLVYDSQLVDEIYSKVNETSESKRGHNRLSSAVLSYKEFLENLSSTYELPQLPLQMITYGAPGTGKSYATNGVTCKYPANHTIRTTFHPDSDYSTFVGAYKPTKDDKGNITYEFVPQAFIQAYIKAWKNLESPVFLIIEEINRGNCAQIFGDIFQLLDRNETGMSQYEITPDKDIQEYIASQKLNIEGITTNDESEDISDKLMSGELMSLPSNLYIWATMNTSDQSLFPIDSAFKRRWEWDYVPIENYPDKNWKIKTKNGLYDWWTFLQAINTKIGEATQSEDKKLGYFFVKANDTGEILSKTFVGKVIFYLWNDVFKDTEFSDDIFKSYEKTDTGFQTITFQSFYQSRGIINEKMVDHFLANLELENEVAKPDTLEGDATVESK